MSRLVKQLQNNRSVVFDKGKFDEWCVYVVEVNGYRKAHFDETYFGYLQSLSSGYPSQKIYTDFVRIYDLTTKFIDAEVLHLIDSLVLTYHPRHHIPVEQWFAVIYAGMIAEENKQYAVLRKRIKRLGMHQVLIQNMPAKTAASFSYGKKWQELDAIMKPLGF